MKGNEWATVSVPPQFCKGEGVVEVVYRGGGTYKGVDRQAVSKVDNHKDKLKGSSTSLCQQTAVNCDFCKNVCVFCLTSQTKQHMIACLAIIVTTHDIPTSTHTHQ